MKKRYLAAGILAAGVLLAGCQSAGGETGAVLEQHSAQAAQSMADNGIQATAPKGNENQSSDDSAASSAQALTADVQSSSQSTSQDSAGNAAQNESQSGTSASGGQITEAQAKEIALTDAGVSEADVGDFIRIRPDRDDGYQIYEVEFYVGAAEYDYDIDASTGTILSRDYDIEDDFANTSAGVLDQDSVIQIVLERVPGASAQNVRIELDEDDGRLKYEGELYYNHVEYEFEINAETGEILEWSEEQVTREERGSGIMRILVAEDQKDMNRLISRRLAEEQYSVDSCYNGQEVLDYLECAEYDAIVLDIMMPVMDGLQVLKKLRAREDHIPVLLLTARDSVEDRVSGLDAGADDYLVKPFAFEELLARIRVMLRKPAAVQTTVSRVADLEVHMDTRQVFRQGKEIRLSGKEFSLLRYMVQNSGIVLSREKLEQHIWNYDYAGGSNVIDVYIRYLRKKIDDGYEKKLIHTVRGAGYVLKE